MAYFVHLTLLKDPVDSVWEIRGEKEECFRLHRQGCSKMHSQPIHHGSIGPYESSPFLVFVESPVDRAQGTFRRRPKRVQSKQSSEVF